LTLPTPLRDDAHALFVAKVAKAEVAMTVEDEEYETAGWDAFARSWPNLFKNTGT
jgi:hypothetical protein